MVFNRYLVECHGVAGVVVSCKIPILATRVRFPGDARFFFDITSRHSLNSFFVFWQRLFFRLDIVATLSTQFFDFGLKPNFDK